MVATVKELGPAHATVHYFERDGYYAKDDPEHRRASFWHGRLAKALLITYQAHLRCGHETQSSSRARRRPRIDGQAAGNVVSGPPEPQFPAASSRKVSLVRNQEGPWPSRACSPEAVRAGPCGLRAGDEHPGSGASEMASISTDPASTSRSRRRNRSRLWRSYSAILRVIQAHDEAVRDTLDWFESDRLQTRGYNPETESARGCGPTAWSWRDSGTLRAAIRTRSFTRTMWSQT